MIVRLLPKERELIPYALTFLCVLAAAKFGQYLFFEWKTSPAIIWPPTGIAVAILWVYGYRYAVPVFAALFIASLTAPLGSTFPPVITTPLGQVGGLMLIVYLLKRFSFDSSFTSIRSTLIFFIAIIFGCALAPTITTSVSFITGNLTTAAYLSWTRAWAGYVFSVLILYPFVVSWLQKDTSNFKVRINEVAFVAGLLVTSVYMLFWEQIPSELSFMIFAVFFISHLWASRFSMRIIATFSVITTVLGILGIFLSPRPDTVLSSQLLSTQLFLMLVVPIFYTFSALVKERAATFQTLRDTLDKIEKENVNKNEFIAILAHELRNPLSPIKTTLEIIGLETQNSETKKLLKGAHQQVHTMRRLLDDLLDTTRMSQGKFQLQIEHANLCDMLRRAVYTTKELLDERKHRIVLDPKCDDSVWLAVDPVRFEQVVVNILNNAAKYTEPGGRIEIDSAVKNGHAVLSIRDNGVGIENANLENIFNSFWQAGGTNRHATGIGVGLSLTKQIVEMHGGTISVKSDGLGKGSTFTVTMPLAKTRSVVVEEEDVVRSIPLFKILVADDNTAAANALAKLLRLKGHIVETAYSGKEVLEMASVFSPTIVLLDIGLPDMTGYEVTDKLRKDGFVNKIVALTGYGQKEDKDKAFEAGFDHHLTKPMAISRLEEYLLTIG